MHQTPGIPPELLYPLRETLADCEEFESYSRLRAVFADERLAPWQKQLPRADSIMELVDEVITFLRGRQRSDTGANLLVLLLVVLKDRTNPDDALYLRLRDLAEALGKVLQSNIAPPRPHIVEEANPENQQMFFTENYRKLLESCQAVGQIKVPQIVRGQVKERFPTGTGWLIAPNLAMTCWHVIKARNEDDPIRETDREMQAKNSVLAFDYLLPGQGIEYRVTTLECYDSALDYVLLRLEDRLDHPLSTRGFLKRGVFGPLTLQTRVCVIQHPNSQPQQVAPGRLVNEKEGQPEHIFHNAPTEHGTSGAPVLNIANWEVVALHNGEDENANLREATLLKAILAHIQLTRPDLNIEIMNAH